jgi:hypothetical protein
LSVSIQILSLIHEILTAGFYPIKKATATLIFNGLKGQYIIAQGNALGQGFP